ncbi:MAG: YbjQ family protein [Actinobacteria bacterium]|nr:YbjQ family protein [Actinomycetota bacterium]
MGIDLFFGLVLPVLLLVVGGAVGRLKDHRHEASLRRREAELAGFVVTAMPRIPGRPEPVRASLVLGEVVIASDYGKQSVARLRNLVGGELRSYRRLVDRGRREALLRAVDQARSRRASGIVNARFETSMITANAAEVICYGTAIGD